MFHKSTLIAWAACFGVLGGGALFAQNTGSIFVNQYGNGGWVVNANVLPSKNAAFLSGGPQNTNSHGLPLGNYYYQVTDPSGKVLLSTDDITCRIVQVLPNSGNEGVIYGVPAGSPSCAHPDALSFGIPKDPNGGDPLQLMPFSDTPNNGGEYKTWLTPVASYSPGNGTFGFLDSASKTDNFKVNVLNAATVVVCKFQDVSGNGIYDSSNDPLIPNWPITATGITASPITSLTGSKGCVSFSTNNFTGKGDTTGFFTTATITLSETPTSPWTQTAPANGLCTASLTGTFTAQSQDSCNVSGAGSATPPTSGGQFTVTVTTGDSVMVGYFGNTSGSAIQSLQVSKTAFPGYKAAWTIAKSLTSSQSEIDDTTGQATFSYAVNLASSYSGYQVQGVISLFNPNSSDITGVTVNDVDSNGGNCVVGTGGWPGTVGTVPKNSTVNLNYTCTYSSNPGSGSDIATAMYQSSQVGGSASYDFANATVADGAIDVTDSLAGYLAKVSVDPGTGRLLVSNTSADITSTSGAGTLGPVVLNYSLTFTDPPGTCTTHTNTATFTSTSSTTTGTTTPAITVKQCVGADLLISKVAQSAYSASISKSVDKTKVEQAGGNITFNYTVTVTESNWTVTGTITVKNPNDWESVTANVTDSIDNGGSCIVSGGAGAVLAALATANLPYTCTYTINPTLSFGTNTASAKVTAGLVPTTTVSGQAIYSFSPLTVTDTFSGASPTCAANAAVLLGTMNVTINSTVPNTSSPSDCGLTISSPSFGVFKYARTVPNSSYGTCTSYNNTAQIVNNGQVTGTLTSGPVTVTVCNTTTGALTMGFWQNKNGQGIIQGQSPSGVCPSGLWLAQLNPFQDISATATCNQVASYVTSIIKGATCSGPSSSPCNAMLRAQMLSTALDVYFSDPGLGGNKIGAFSGLGTQQPKIGSIAVDLSHICSMADGNNGASCTGVYEDARPEFGVCTGTNTPVIGCTSGYLGSYINPSGYGILTYADYSSLLNGVPVATPTTGLTWYKNVKSLQVVAKDVFDNINNQTAPIAPAGTIQGPVY